MDSKLAVLEHLIETGMTFTFQNFCYPNEHGYQQYAGADGPEWKEWITRSRNVSHEVMSEGSASVALLEQARHVVTKGYKSSKFEEKRGLIIHAMEIAHSALKSDVFGELRTTKSESNSPAISNKVFIVHGHDIEFKNDCERFVHEIGLEPVVLHRQIDNGQTIIEKIETHGDVGYAFILLSPDEIAYPIGQAHLEDSAREKEYRPRPNVLFEFGYFVSRLGRQKVCCIHKGDVSIPSDLAGLVYKKIASSIDEQGYSIIRELKNAGYNIKV